MTTGFNIATDITRYLEIPNYVMEGIYNEYFMQLLSREGVKIDSRQMEDAKGRKTREEAITKKRNEAIEQIKAYCEDTRLLKENMKKFIVVYVGEKLELLEEVEI